MTSDPDLDSISADTAYNGAILEFDFIPADDTIRFKYVFASDEYPEYVGSSYNDVFGFFLSGPNIQGGMGYVNDAINIALIPGTTLPVTINNVNLYQNNSYYVDNEGGLSYGTAIQYDGTTTILTAIAKVDCGETYHIKLAIANVGDEFLDSGVFLEAESFAVDVVEVDLYSLGGGTAIVEGCSTAEIIFTRPEDKVDNALSINYRIEGSATMGTDYINLTNPITFLPGQDTVVLTLTPIEDGILETPESITLTVDNITGCGTIITTERTIWLMEKPIADFSMNEVSGCAPVSVDFTNNSINANNYIWNFGNSNIAVSDMSLQQFVFNKDEVVTLIAIDGNCTDTISKIVDVDFCVSAPNIFTPNNTDKANSTFFLTAMNAISIDLQINNRWGATVFQEKGVNPEWDGSYNGKDVPEGVYFYNYIAIGPTGESVSGNGFLHLFR